MARRIVLFVLILLIPTVALASPKVFYTLGGGLAPYEPVAPAPHDMFSETAELMTVDFIDRGGADSILLRCGGKSMIVDGADFNQFRFIQAALAAFQVRHFDYMINTHAHDDHIEGLIAILSREYEVGTYLSCYEEDYKESAEFLAVRDLLKLRNIPYRRIGDGDRLTLGDADVYVFRDETPGIDKNRHSLVIKVVYGRSSVLLMADAGMQTQDYLLGLHGPDVFKADVLKFAHHGITTMSVPFLAAVFPEVAVVTNNRADVPLTDRQLAHFHIPRFYTHAGVVHMETDGQLWRAEQMPPDWPPNGN
jgi:competence protein ComEC